MKKELNKIELVFAELKKNGVIPSNRKLRSSILTPNFRSAIIFRNTISYNRKFRDMQEEDLRFCLLHEEGHKIKTQYGTPCLFCVSFFALIPFVLMEIFFNSYPVLVFSSLIYSLILIIIALGVLRQFIHDDEFDSDLFAAEILRDYYGIKKPSYIAYNTFEEVYSIMHPKYSQKVTLFGKLGECLFFYNLHPSTDKRVKKIAHLVDNY